MLTASINPPEQQPVTGDLPGNGHQVAVMAGLNQAAHAICVGRAGNAANAANAATAATELDTELALLSTAPWY